ncbi:hypothetical protein R3P38DRAFT_2507671 [Favolaschia claudopus]|uniref:Uncharacterized protein n=1 Tax=Favolaschia claudopus TaxID=2862362 RepID=A0AAW0D470_9AGAR
MATRSTHHEYDPYQDAYDMPQLNQTSASTLLPNRTATFEKSSLPRTRTEELLSRGASEPIWPILLTGVLIILAVALVDVGVVIQVFARYDYHITGGAIITAAPLGTTLAIVHLSSLVIGLSIPIAIGTAAYGLAGRWIDASRVDGTDRPTPYQLGILMQTLNGANLEALWNGSRYMVGRGAVPGGKSLSRPPILRNAVLMLLFFLTIGYGTNGIETWLGLVSTGVLYPVTETVRDGPVPLYGRVVNQTMCDGLKDAFGNKPYQCGFSRGSGGNPLASSQRILAMNDVSHDMVIAFTDNSTAIMVPPTANISDRVGWVAKAAGVKAVCKSVTSQCVDPKNAGPNAGLDTNCPASVNFNTSTPEGCNSFAGSVHGGPLGADGSPLACNATANSTTFRWGAQIISQAYNTDATVNNAFVGDTGFFLHGNQGGYNILTCELQGVEVTYHYFNGTYTQWASVPSDLDQAQRLSDGSRAGLRYVADTVEGVGLFSGNYADAFAKRLALVTLSTTAYVMGQVEAISVENTTSHIGSRMPIVPFLLLFIFTAVYILAVALITANAAVQIKKSPYTRVARSRLVDPTTAIGAAYGPTELKSRAAANPEELFGQESPSDRLKMALNAPTDGLPLVRRSSPEPAYS